MSGAQRILDEVRTLAPEIVRIRREIHQQPELGFAEYETARLVAGILRDSGYEVREEVAGTGVVGIRRGSRPGRTIALRADMDALPVEEQTGAVYASRRPGIMHACGHDAHVAMVLGVAMLAARLGQDLPGNIVLLFQPSEEMPPGGAKPMIEAGVLSDPPVEAVLGLHVDPYLPAGAIGLKEGPLMAAADKFTILIRGEGGHGAAPHQAVDAIVVGAQVISALQAVTSRQVNPLEPVVVTIGTVNAGQRFNIIAETMTMTGTVRTLSGCLRAEMPRKLERIVHGVCSAYGASYTLDYEWGYPVLSNHQQVLALARRAALDVVGPRLIVPLSEPSMGGEDFAYFAEKVPGAFVYLGVGFAGEGRVQPWHSPRFDLNEEALPIGAAFLYRWAELFLGGEQGGGQ